MDAIEQKDKQPRADSNDRDKDRLKAATVELQKIFSYFFECTYDGGITTQSRLSLMIRESYEEEDVLTLLLSFMAPSVMPIAQVYALANVLWHTHPEAVPRAKPDEKQKRILVIRNSTAEWSRVGFSRMPIMESPCIVWFVCTSDDPIGKDLLGSILVVDSEILCYAAFHRRPGVPRYAHGLIPSLTRACRYCKEHKIFHIAISRRASIRGLETDHDLWRFSEEDIHSLADSFPEIKVWIHY